MLVISSAYRRSHFFPGTYKTATVRQGYSTQQFSASRYLKPVERVQKTPKYKQINFTIKYQCRNELFVAPFMNRQVGLLIMNSFERFIYQEFLRNLTLGNVIPYATLRHFTVFVFIQRQTKYTKSVQRSRKQMLNNDKRKIISKFPDKISLPLKKIPLNPLYFNHNSVHVIKICVEGWMLSPLVVIKIPRAQSPQMIRRLNYNNNPLNTPVIK